MASPSRGSVMGRIKDLLIWCTETGYTVTLTDEQMDVLNKDSIKKYLAARESQHGAKGVPATRSGASVLEEDSNGNGLQKKTEGGGQ